MENVERNTGGKLCQKNKQLSVWEAAGVGATTLFKYFRNKENLVIAISGMVWKKIWQDTLTRYGEKEYAEFTAYEMIRNCTSCLIRIYRENPEIFRFSGNYKTFICRRGMRAEDLREHLDPLEPVRTMFHQAYLRVKTDHSIRTDISEEVLFTSVAIAMLAAAERYAQGIVWANRNGTDHTQELLIIQEMILNWCAGENSHRPLADTH